MRRGRWLEPVQERKVALGESFQLAPRHLSILVLGKRVPGMTLSKELTGFPPAYKWLPPLFYMQAPFCFFLSLG